jgi:hypothetical protein
MNNYFLNSIKEEDNVKNLNDRNDITRMAYSSSSLSPSINKGNLDYKVDNYLEKTKLPIVNNDKSRQFVNLKTNFETNNSRLNSLNDEIQSLKKKLKVIYEKDEIIEKKDKEIKDLNIQMEGLNIQIVDLKTQIDTIMNLKEDNDSLNTELELFKIKDKENMKILDENILLKKKLLELVKKHNKEINKYKNDIENNEQTNKLKKKINNLEDKILNYELKELDLNNITNENIRLKKKLITLISGKTDQLVKI